MELAKVLIVVGLGMALLGVLVGLGEHLPAHLRLFHLPGDIRIERDGFSFYLPITTMVLLSLTGSGVLWVIRWWKGT
jgi:hypothetical protein